MLEFLFLTTIVMVIVALSVYFYVDFSKHKEDVSKEFDDLNKEILIEKEDRLANLANVVDNINTSNEKLYDDYKTQQDTQTSNLNTLTTRYNNFESGFGSIINQVDKTTGTIVPLSSSNVNVDIQLIKHVSMLGGITIKDLQNSTSNINLKACGSGNNSNRCIRLPDTNGDTYLTSLTENGSIVADSVLKTNNIIVNGRIDMKTTSNVFMSLTDDVTKNKAVINTSNKLLRLDSLGLEIPSAIILMNADNSYGVTSLYVNTDGEVVITNANNIRLNGNVVVSGSLTNNDGVPYKLNNNNNNNISINKR